MDTKSIQPKDLLFCAQLEFALNYLSPAPSRLERLSSQLELKLSSGQGECHYTLGLDSDGLPLGLSPSVLDRAISTLQGLASGIFAHLRVLSREKAENGMIAHLLISKPKALTVSHSIWWDLTQKEGY